MGSRPRPSAAFACRISVDRRISDSDLGDLLVLLPQLERLLPGLPRPPAADPETERYLLVLGGRPGALRRRADAPRC